MRRKIIQSKTQKLGKKIRVSGSPVSCSANIPDFNWKKDDWNEKICIEINHNTSTDLV
jgi:hypothetical protein